MKLLNQVVTPMMKHLDITRQVLTGGRGRVYWFPRAAITNYQKFGGLKQLNLLSHSSGG